ncbi:Histidine kinase [Saliniradius amylolyticus]|uniref:Chemotaxis protein CheA n=1 Tax=Saliniradius amylolyticus TaxID=2183582 RepID=A0A2S2E106_9ALTE|nr:chemotaxis protein CheA [Saliniradius amylolyticus]AWL11296.1 Histidine kinase [Saliniradius amylolyticus]
MAYDVDEEILQDFLIEAGEILDQLQEQLVDLENNPDDQDLLNAIFRSFHTVKGGAGFLSLTELVDICHGAENVFDILRNGQRQVTSDLMDVILESLDTVNDMFERVKAREDLEPASPELLDTLHRLSKPESEDEKAAAESAPAEPEPDPEPEAPTPSENAEQAGEGDSIDEITEDEFEALLDELHGPGSGPSKAEKEAASAAPSGEKKGEDGDEDITDEEFEALLDELHGEGKFKAGEEPDKKSTKEAAATSSGEGDEEIDEDEFEALLDQLHGKGKGPGADEDKSAAPSPSPSPAPSPSPKSESGSPKPAPAPKPTPAVKKPATNDKKPERKAAAAPPAETTVRVDTKRLDEIMNMVGELVLVRNRLLTLGNNVTDENMTKAISNLDVVTGDLQGAVMKTRMQPIKKVFGRFPRVVRDLARSLKKEITLSLEGEETDLDKNLVEALADPLVHLVRNSVDHGIEMPDEREDVGKPRMGNVKLAASQEGDHILLTIQDDGKGMDPEKLKEIAINRGVLDPDSAARLSDTEAFNLIFAPGFSTKTEISDISGRGVGMDVVKTKINQLNGTIHIDSEKNVGTRLDIKVPLTLAILPTLMVVIGEQTFALPLGAVSEIINVDESRTNTVDGQLTMIVRNKAIPLFYLREWLVRNPSPEPIDRSKGHVVVVQQGTQQFGFVVDSLIGQEEVVIKPLDKLLQGTPGMAGATITSDGGIALIVDIPSLVKHYGKKSR